jgi:hypothetical protein
MNAYHALGAGGRRFESGHPDQARRMPLLVRGSLTKGGLRRQTGGRAGRNAWRGIPPEGAPVEQVTVTEP